MNKIPFIYPKKSHNRDKRNTLKLKCIDRSNILGNLFNRSRPQIILIKLLVRRSYVPENFGVNVDPVIFNSNVRKNIIEKTALTPLLLKRLEL